MARPKYVPPPPPHVKQEDLHRRRLKSAHVAEHTNGHAKPKRYDPVEDDDYNPSIGG